MAGYPKPIRMTSLCTAGIATHAAERNPRWQTYPYQLKQKIFFSGSEAIEKKSKRQESFCCCLEQNVPGHDAIVRLCPHLSSFCHLFQHGASSIPLFYRCQHSSRGTASRVNDEQGDRWFLLSTGVMAPSLLSVIEPGWLTHTQTGWQTFTSLEAWGDLLLIDISLMSPLGLRTTVLKPQV